MPGAAVNTSPLIFLARLGRLDALRVFDPLVTTRAVIAEVEAGSARGHAERVPVGRLVDEGLLKVRKADLRPVEGYELDPGELSVLRLAEAERLPNVVVDDLAAIRAARQLSLSPRSTAFVLLDAAAAGRVPPKQFKTDLEALMRAGYHLSAPLYVFLLEAAAKLERR